MFENPSNAFLKAQELVRLVSKFGPKRQLFTSVHELEESSEGQPAQLYRALLSTEEASERAMLKNLPESFNRKRYPKIRSELIEDLYRLVFVLDLKRANYSEYAQRLNDLRKAVFLATTLSAMGSSFVAVDLAEKFIEEARDLEEWEYTLHLLGILREFASRSGKHKAFEAYSEEYLRTLDLIHYWQKAEIVKERIVSNFARSGSEKPWLKEETDKALAELAPAIEKHKTFKLGWLALRLRQYGLQLEMDYTEALRIADESDALHTEYPQFENQSKRATIERSRLTCLLQTLRYAEAKAAIERLEKLEPPGTNNWYYFKEWNFIYLMRTEQFEAARSLTLSVIESKEFNLQTQSLRDKYQLFLLWADFFTGRKLPMEEKQKNEKTGAISKGLLRLFPSLEEDQAGFKISVLLLEILIQLERRKSKAGLVSRVDSIKLYRFRYLQGETAKQAELFITLIELLIARDYSAIDSEREGKPILEELSASILEQGIRGEELMPLDWIWKIMLEICK